MDVPSQAQRALRMLAATLVVGAATALLVFLGANSTTAGLVYLALEVWFAAQSGITLALIIAILCALAFDYCFLTPLHTFQIVGVQQWVAMICFLVSCGVVARVAEVARRQTHTAEQRRTDVERLYELSQAMMVHDDPAGLVSHIPDLISHIFALDGVVLYVEDQDRFFSSISDLPMSVQASLRALQENSNPTLSIPGELFAVALTFGLRRVGAIAWRPDTLTREVAAAVGAQIAIALTRALAIDASMRLEAAREGERLRSALVDSLTHELRTPLTAIRAAATTLRQGELLDEPTRADLASLVDEESRRLDALIGQAVEMAEIDAHSVQVRPVLQNAQALLDQAVEESRTALARHQVFIQVSQPDHPVWFDPHLLGRVLRHLLENAARYSPPGSRIALRAYRTDDRLEFAVEDSGPGIDGVDLPLIFEKFYRGKKGRTAGKGTGMGLAIARAIITALGGGIDVVSAAGKGTIFTFWVPLVEKETAG